MGRLKNKVVVITGGASGIGKASVNLFVKEGAKVIFLDIMKEKGTILDQELGANAIFFHGDVRNELDIKGVINKAVEQYGRLNCIFNNSGISGANGFLEDISIKAFDETINILLRSSFLGMKYATPIMKKQKSGSIINTASVAGIMTGAGPHIYSAAKAAIIHLSRSIAMELAEYNIRVNCICPGAIATPIFGRGLGMDQNASERLANLLKMEFKSIQPIPRAGLPEDIANAALWLASDDSSFISGHALVVDGAMSLGNTPKEFRNGFEELVKTLKLGDLDDIIKKVNKDIESDTFYKDKKSEIALH
jgi:NAD(P)-dependent dehydrogenase (short-subunit alcohol dehydrogenase family)